MLTAKEALEKLREGNARFAAGKPSREIVTPESKRAALAKGQHPFAIIVGCSDSRVPAEIVFDKGVGDLFVIRVAGNIVAPSQVGSVEFAAAKFGTRLVVVLGHSSCGAVVATLEELERPPEQRSPNLQAIVERIKPPLKTLKEAAPELEGHALLRQSVRANVRAAAHHLRHGSAILEQLGRDEGLLVVGAEYDLETGRVDFFDGLPQDA